MGKTLRVLIRAMTTGVLMLVAACASQTEMARLQQEVTDLQNQLAFEKQRQALAMAKLKQAQSTKQKEKPATK